MFITGGFLGSGKTTAIRQAAKYYIQKRKTIGIITNDQGSRLVDTGYLQNGGAAIEEVTGGCFCCHYHELYDKIKDLQIHQKPDIIFAESVGSCTDLVATVINPLLHFNQGQFDIVLSVFADIRVLCDYLGEKKSRFHHHINYIYEKQLEEADLIVVNKIDLMDENQLQTAKALITAKFGGKTLCYQSSLSGSGIRQWLSALDNHTSSSRLRPTPEVDYDRYGSGEAALAWLDRAVNIQTPNKNAVDAGITLINTIYAGIAARNYPLGHLKFLLDDGHQKIKISFTALQVNEPYGEFEYYETDRVAILINARVQTKAVLLTKIVDDALEELKFLTGCNIETPHSDTFHPGYPRPSFRMQQFSY